MAYSEDEIFFDPDDLELEESLKGFDISFSIPDLSDSGDAETAAAWVESPRVMLEALSNELNEILKYCEPRLYDGVVIQLKPEWFDDSLEIKTDLIWLAFSLGFSAGIVDLVNTIQPTPFRGEILAELGKFIHHGNTPEFDRAISNYKSELVKLTKWIKAKEILSGKVKSDDASSAPQRKSANLDDVKRAYEHLIESGKKPTKEHIIQVIKGWNLTLGSDRAQAMKRQVEKQSAVRPPETAD